MAVGVLFVVLVPVPADAANIGDPPDAAGNYLVCNVSSNAADWGSDAGYVVNSGTPYTVWISCQYGDPQSSPAASGVVYGGRIFMSRVGSTSNGWAGSFGSHYPTPDSGTFETTVDSNGLLRGVWTYTPSVTSVVIPFCNAANTNNDGAGTTGVSFDSASGTSRQCEVIARTYNGSGYPNYPADWFTGGSNGSGIQDIPLPVLTCSRTLDQTLGSLVGRFLASQGTVDDDVEYEWSWDFGDSSGSSTSRRPTYTYGDLSTMPDGGWIAEVTLVATVTLSNHLFTNGTEVDTQTCSLRVDFLNPDESDPGSSDPEADDPDCPTGWGWLNPLAITRILKCLFVPTDSLTDSWDDLVDAADTSYPLGPATFAVGVLVDAYQEFNEGLTGNESGTGQLSIICSGTSGSADTGFSVPLFDDDDGISEPSDSLTVPVLPGTCGHAISTGDAAWDDRWETAQTWVRWITSTMFVLGFALWIVRQAMAIMGGSGNDVSGGTERSDDGWSDDNDGGDWMI